MEPVIRSDHRSFVLMIPDREWVFVSDPEGRIEMAHTAEAAWKRSRFNTWHRTRLDPWPTLEPADPAEIRAQLPEWIGAWTQVEPAVGDTTARRILQLWIREFEAFHEADGARFAQLFPAIPILPPDNYRALYVRVQHGCPWNRCTFCNFYKDQNYHVVPIDGLQQHLEELRAYWGAAARSRHGIFLGDANAVAIPAAALIERMEQVRRSFPQRELLEFHSFIDYFAGPRRSARDLESLRKAGLRRISLGVESGDSRLMGLMDKPVEFGDVRHLVDCAKEAGLLMNLIFLVGLGGKEFRETHRARSVKLLAALRLRSRDRVYLSPLVLHEDDAQHPDRARGQEPLSREELVTEVRLWQEELRVATPAQVSPYLIRNFIY